MQPLKQTTKDFFRANDILFFALLGGQVMFSLIMLGLLLTEDNVVQADANFVNILLVVVIFISATSVVASIKVYQLKLQSIPATVTLAEKLVQYRSACIIRWALLEFPSFLAIIASFLTGSIIFLALAGIVMVYFYTIKPTPEKAANDLNLDMNERIKITDPDSLL
ncbi:MAG: hypothetical protein U0W24_16810 [Bacteroidales bacterium]